MRHFVKKVVQMWYKSKSAAIGAPCNLLSRLVAGGGFEPPTFGL
jgi:hypothetical protein